MMEDNEQSYKENSKQSHEALHGESHGEDSGQSNAQNHGRNEKKSSGGVGRIFLALLYSRDGLCAALSDEAAFRQALGLGIILFVTAIFIADDFSSFIMLVAPLFISLIVELLNSAIENAIDYISLEMHPLAKKAKDMGSAAQLLALLFIALVWVGYIVGLVF